MDKILDENGVDFLLLEDSSGVLLIEDSVSTSVPNALMMMGIGSFFISIFGSLINYILSQFK